MVKVDLDEYYAEQEERMNIPNETVEEYLKRVASFKRRQSSNACASTSRQPHPSLIPESPDIVSQELYLLPATVARVSDDVNGDCPEEPGRTKNRKTITASDPKQKGAVTDQDNGTDITFFPEDKLVRLSTPVAHEAKDLQVEERYSSPSIEDIDSFTVSEVYGAHLPPNVTSRKRHTSTKEACDVPPKKRRLVQARSLGVPQAELSTELSPISSFSRIIDPVLVKRQSSRKDEIATIPKQPRLDFRPLNEVPLSRQPAKARTKSLKVSSPSSPIIEDSSFTVNAPPAKEALKPESSDMYLEVKERIAKHQPTKSRDRVVRLGPKLILPQPNVNTVAAETVDESSIIYVSSSPSSRANSPEPVKQRVTKQTEKKKDTKLPVEKKMPKGKKEKPPPMTPAEYARMLHEKASASNGQDGSTSITTQRKRGPNFRFLEGKNIFYTGGDMKHASETTRKRMQIIVRHGGNLMPEYDSTVTTHIITEAHMLPTLRALGVKRLKDIPDHIPTVKWTWVLSVLGRQSSLSKDEIEDKLGNVWLYAAFGERMDAGYQPKPVRSMTSFKMKAKVQGVREQNKDRASTSVPGPAAPLAQSSSVQSEMEANNSSGAPVSPPTSPLRPAVSSKTTSSKVKDDSIKVAQEPTKRDSKDPLAEFYDQAVAQRNNEDGWSSLGEFDMQDSNGEESDRDSFEPTNGHVPLRKKGWTCDIKEPERRTQYANQDIIDKLTELMELHKAKLGDENHWRAFSYSKAIRALRSYPHRIKNFEEARAIRGVGDKTARKIEEILQTGDLRRIAYEKTKDVEITKLFQGIYGVGQSIAFQWYSAGCRTLNDLGAGKGGVKLTSVQEIGLRYYDDINLRMPREEARQIFELIKPIALSVDSKLFIEIMGSYRRGKATCGDIDILITRPTDDGLTHRGVLPRLLQELHLSGILTEDLAIPDDPHDLEGIYRGLCRLPNVEGSKRRRIDFLTVPWTSRGAALLYYTGDDIFNRAMRLKANVLGYSLNQKGLFGNVIRDPRDRRVKMNDGVVVASETEEEIFKILDVPWQEPHERVRG